MKRVHPLPTPECMASILRYDGKDFYWRARPQTAFQSEAVWKRWNTRWAGQRVALAHVSGGYRGVRFSGVTILAHRAAWVLSHGEWPADCIDHINGDVADNRIGNLRDCSRSANMRNQKLNSRNTSGVPGVSWNAQDKRWRARAYLNRRCVSLGSFRLKDDAIAARREAERRFGYHENHGRKIPLPNGPP